MRLTNENMANRLGFAQFFSRDKAKTFKPKKRFDEGTMKFNLHKQANASLSSGIDLKEVVRLPPNEDLNDWIAVHEDGHTGFKFMEKFKNLLHVFNHMASLFQHGFDWCTANCTFKPKKRFDPGSLKYNLHKQANASLNSGIDLRDVVRLPANEDLNDWFAVHVVDFFNRINLLYGTICEYCTEETCPTMSGGPKYEYQWCDTDSAKYKKPTALPAPKYIALLMDWVESQINDENIFPVKVGVPFPKNYLQVVKKLLTRLYRVFVHVYIHHFDTLVALGAEAHVNTCYKHFYYFVVEYHLVDKKELEPLREMTEKMCH